MAEIFQEHGNYCLSCWYHPPQQVVKAYQDVGLHYEESYHDRVWRRHFYPKVKGNNKLKEQEIKYQIDSLQRLKNYEGEWLTWHVTLFAKDWQDDRIDFSYVETIDARRSAITIANTRLTRNIHYRIHR